MKKIFVISLLLVFISVAFSGNFSGVGDYAINGHGFIDVRIYGATGDGTTDDTAAIQAAIAAAPQLGTIYLPNGNYYISGELDVAKNLYFKGDGWDTQIYQSSTTLNLFHVTATGQVVFENMKLASEATTAGKCLIRLDAPCSHAIIRNVSMLGGYYGIGLYGAIGVLIEHPCNTTTFYRGCCNKSGMDIRGAVRQQIRKRP